MPNQLEKQSSTDSLDTVSVDSDESLSEWLGELGLAHLTSLLNEHGIHDLSALYALDASLNSLPYIPDEDKDRLLSALKGADLNEDIRGAGGPVTDQPSAAGPSTRKESTMSVDLDDLLTQFLEMECELNMVSTVKHRPPKEKKQNSSAYRMSIMALGNTDEKDLDSLLDDLCNDIDEINNFTFSDVPSPTTPVAAKQETFEVPAPLRGSSDQLLPPPPTSFEGPPAISEPPPPPPPPHDSNPDLMAALERDSDRTDVRSSVCTTSSGASAGTEVQRSSLYTSSGVSSYLTSSSSSELYDSKLSLDSTSTDFRESDYKHDPMNIPSCLPDTEPFFIDNTPSSDSPTTPITPGPKSTKIQRRLTMILKEKENLTEEEKAAILKKEKLKIALEKLRVASNLKMAMKAYNVDNSSKTIWVEQKQTAWDVCQILAEKNYFKPGTDWNLVEHITDLEIERELEDHEVVYDVLNSWSRDSTNKIYFRNNARKYELFRRPQLFLFTDDSYANVVDLSRECRQVLIDDFFSGTANTRIPSIGLRSVHWLKSGKKSWRKMNFIIRDSAIYYAGKAKSKGAALSWTSFARIDDNDIFLPANNKDFRKQHKAPTEFCFLIRTRTNAREQHRSTRCICVEDELQFRLWTNALRRLQYGSKLRTDHAAAVTWLEQQSEKSGQRPCLSPTLPVFGDRASIVMPEIDDNAGDIFAARFGSAWNNGDTLGVKEAPSLLDLHMETDNEGMTRIRLHQ